MPSRRPGNGAVKPPVIQTFNDGVLAVYGVGNAADDGNMPVELLTLKHPALRYCERTVGINRFYKAKQEGVEIALVLRIPRLRNISTQDVVRLNDKRQFRIEQVQYPENVTPPCCDISLVKLVANYDLDRV